MEVKYSGATNKPCFDYDKKKIKSVKAKAKEKADNKSNPNHGLVKKYDSNGKVCWLLYCCQNKSIYIKQRRKLVKKRKMVEPL